MKRLTVFAVVALLMSVFAFGGTASASSDCSFTVEGSTMTLNGDCTTDETIAVPDGFTLDGAGHTITAVDPPSGSFLGAIVRNGGTVANVTNLHLTTDDLAIACHAASPVDTRLRGILFNGASGSITFNVVDNVNQGASGCQEGNAIEVRNAPFDGTHPNTQTVEIAHNIVTNYQKTGIVTNGDVLASIHHNDVGASATQANLAANSIQVGFGAMASVEHNSVDGNQWQTASAAASAILVFDAGTTLVGHNDIGGQSDVGIYVNADSGITVEYNTVLETGADGYYDIGIGNYNSAGTDCSADNSYDKNKVGGFETAYDCVNGGKNKTIPQPAD